MRSKLLLLIITVTCVLAGCSDSGKKFTVICNIKGLPADNIILEELGANDLITVIDSTKPSADGHFELSGNAPEPGLYRLHFTNKKFILLSVDKGNMKITADWNELENYKVEGSKPSEDLKVFLSGIREHLRDFNTMGLVMDSLRAKGNDSILTAARNDFQNMREKFTQAVERYADSTPYEPNKVFAARILNPATESSFLQSFSQGLTRSFPNTKMTRDFTEYYQTIVAKKQMKQLQKAGTDAGSMATDISLPTPDGKTITLSSLKGKYVLLDFWASWCSPCRGENPNVVNAYNRFKDKNFTVYGVSLDKDKDAWQKAISDDGLVWTQVSELKGWESSVVATYGIQSIPANFLIDPTGKIIAQNLRGPQLEEMLQSVLKSDGAGASTK